MTGADVESVYRSLDQFEIGKPLDYIARCWEENVSGRRVTLIAEGENRFAGWLHLVFRSDYAYFAERNIPEINNLDVLPPMRRLGIANALMETVERIAFDRFGIVGVGVGLYSDYGSAQRLYAKRGYVPDGRGLMYLGEPAKPGDYVQVGHDLALYLIKERA